MEEKGVFWKPSRKTGAVETKAVNAGELQAAVRQLCESAGFDCNDFLAAAGTYGSWLVRLARAGDDHRIVWNGKERRMVLEASRGQAGWDELGACAADGADIASLLDGVKTLLDSSPGDA